MLTNNSSADAVAQLEERVVAAGPRLSAGHLIRDRAAEFGRDQWEVLAGTGLFAAALPLEFGGQALSVTLLMHVVEELGRNNRDSGLSFSAATHLASTGVALAKFGNSYIQERYLQDVATGAVIGSHAISENEAGSDVLAMTSTGVVDGNEILLNAAKTYITNGPIADLSVVYVKTSAAGGPLSLTAVLVPRGVAGAYWGPAIEKTTMRSSPFGELTLRDCRIDRRNIIGGIGMGFVVLNHVMTWEILISFVINIGEMQHRLARMIERARSRRQFGAPLSRNQGIQNTIVDCHLAIETARLALYSAATQVDLGSNSGDSVAMAKILTSEANVKTALAAVELFGASGILTETGLEIGVRDALGGPIYSGSNAIQRQKIAKAIGL